MGTSSLLRPRGNATSFTSTQPCSASAATIIYSQSASGVRPRGTISVTTGKVYRDGNDRPGPLRNGVAMRCTGRYGRGVGRFSTGKAVGTMVAVEVAVEVAAVVEVVLRTAVVRTTVGFTKLDEGDVALTMAAIRLASTNNIPSTEPRTFSRAVRKRRTVGRQHQGREGRGQVQLPGRAKGWRGLMAARVNGRRGLLPGKTFLLTGGTKA